MVAGDSTNLRVKPDLHPKKSMMDLGNAQKECYGQKRVGESPVRLHERSRLTEKTPSTRSNYTLSYTTSPNVAQIVKGALHIF